jgi:hypothetical protein
MLIGDLRNYCFCSDEWFLLLVIQKEIGFDTNAITRVIIRKPFQKATSFNRVTIRPPIAPPVIDPIKYLIINFITASIIYM